jgi:sulfur transfer complex TusBCD TusB component (DsrH family)
VKGSQITDLAITEPAARGWEQRGSRLATIEDRHVVTVAERLSYQMATNEDRSA